MLTSEQIRIFQKIYKNNFGKEINQEDAYKLGAKLIHLTKLIYRPITKKDFGKYGVDCEKS